MLGALVLLAAAAVSSQSTAGIGHASILQAQHRYAAISAPVLVRKTEPNYTEAALRRKVEGTVVLYIEVDRMGRPRNIRVVRSLGSGLDEKAIEAVRQWRFRPGLEDGEPVVTPATVEVVFRLSKAAIRV